MIRAAILGGTGYGGMELLRLLLGHPEVEVVALTSRSETGPVAARHPHLLGFTDLSFTREDEATRMRLAQDVDLLFLAKPHGVAAVETDALLTGSEARIIDLSGDFRLKDAAAYPPWYGFEHPAPARLADAVYGLPELGPAARAEIAEARFVANPGCHATAVILALSPLARADLLKHAPSICSVTGSSGSGARPGAGTHHPERFGNFKAYKPLLHQHMPEMSQALGSDLPLHFVPHSAPIARGIHVTAFVPLGGITPAAVKEAFEAAYADEPFVRLRTAPPEVRAVAGTNLADVHVTARPGIALVTVAIDNLGKGMAGTAVQNLNLMFGLEERAGLERPGAGL